MGVTAASLAASLPIPRSRAPSARLSRYLRAGASYARSKYDVTMCASGRRQNAFFFVCVWGVGVFLDAGSTLFAVLELFFGRFCTLARPPRRRRVLCVYFWCPTAFRLSARSAPLSCCVPSLFVSPEITHRFQTARPEVRQLLLQYLLPWLHNMELVDPSVPPANPLSYFQVSGQVDDESRTRQARGICFIAPPSPPLMFFHIFGGPPRCFAYVIPSQAFSSLDQV